MYTRVSDADKPLLGKMPISNQYTLVLSLDQLKSVHLESQL